MINPYAQAFMIATRTEHRAPPRLRPAPEPEPRRAARGWRLFRRRSTVTEKSV